MKYRPFPPNIGRVVPLPDTLTMAIYSARYYRKTSGLSRKSKILNEQREVIESLHKIPVDIINENPHQLVSDWDMLAFLNVITRW